MKKFIKKQLVKISKIFKNPYPVSVRDTFIQQEQNNRKKNHPNKFVTYGEKCFSQTDEDGLTLEIINRIGINKGGAVEFGVGNGMENNTLVLLSLGWKGFWFGGQEILFDMNHTKKLNFKKIWITKENIVNLCQQAQEQITKIDLISLDLDGNDFHLIQEILENNITPSVFIVEYNAKFIPPIEFIIDYNPDHIWTADDYFGASLTSYVKLFEKHSYSLVCCNAATGANAFFVKNEFMSLFPEVPSNLRDIYSPPYYLRANNFGHKQSVRTIEKMINS
ncbi:MAG: hypothetical protein ACSHXF_13200 [Aquaticitalea sp.]